MICKMRKSINKFVRGASGGYAKFADFIRKDKDVITIIISFCVGLGTIIVGCVTIRVSNQQVTLMNRQVELQELIEQPIFRIEKDLVDTYDDGVTFYDTKVINIYNDGAIPQSIQNIDVDEILKFEIHRGTNHYEFLYLVPSFYRIHSPASSLTGMVFTGFSRGNNEEYYEKLYLKTLKDTEPGEFYSIFSFPLTSVDYVDKFGNSHLLYFRDNIQITEEEFKRIYKQSTQYETQFFMDIDNLSYDELMKIAEVYIKEQNDDQK